MAKGDGGGSAFGSQKPLLGQSNFRQKMPMSDTNEMGEQKPTGWQHMINPQFMGNGGSAPDQQMPQKSMFQNMGRMGSMMMGQPDMAKPQVQGPNNESPNRMANMASNMGMLMGNRFGQQNQGQDQFQGMGQGGFNVGPNRGINPGGRFGGGMGIFGGGFGGGRRMFGL